MSRKGFMDRVANVKNELYEQIKEKGIIPLKVGSETPLV